MAWDITKLTEWNPAHLEAAAAFAAEQGPMWMTHFETYRDRLMGLDTWQGMSKEGAWEAASWSANAATQAAYPAINGAVQLTETAGAAVAMQQATLDQITAATADGLLVSPDLKQVTGPPGTQELAEQYAGMIKHYLGQFQCVLEDGARRLEAHSEELSMISFPDSGVKLSAGHTEPHVHTGTDVWGQPQIQMGGAPVGAGAAKATMVDHSFRTDTPQPAPAPAPNPPAYGSVPWAPGRDPGPAMPAHPGVTGRTPDGSPVVRMPAPPSSAGVPVTAMGPSLPPAPPLKDCDPKDYASDVAKVVGGGAGVIGGTAITAGGIAGLPETAGASSAAIGGGLTTLTTAGDQLINGITDIEHCR